jgi:hypothetical protein
MRGREPRLSLQGRIHGVPRENLFLIGAALTQGGG